MNDLPLSLPMTTLDVRNVMGYTRGAKTREEQNARLTDALSWFGIAIQDQPAPARDAAATTLTRTLAEHDIDLSKQPELDRDDNGEPMGGYTLFCRCKHPFRPSSDPDVNEHREHLVQMLTAALRFNSTAIDEALAATDALVLEARSNRVDLQVVERSASIVRNALHVPLI